MARQKFQDQSYRLSSSFPDGLNEEYCFIPYGSFEVRKTSSMDDIYRFYRYFELLESNSDMLLTWRHYLNILQDQLRSYDTITIVSKEIFQKLPVPSNYIIPQIDYLKTSQLPSEIDCEKGVIGDTYSVTSSFDESDSVLSDSSTISINTRARILRAICTETKILAEKIYKTVEMITHLPKKCASCGGTLKASKHSKQCIHSSERIGDTYSMFDRQSMKRVNKMKTISCNKDSSYLAVRSPSAAGESSRKPRIKKLALKKSSMKRLAQMCSQFIRPG